MITFAVFSSISRQEIKRKIKFCLKSNGWFFALRGMTEHSFHQKCKDKTLLSQLCDFLCLKSA
ncbi:hypothetical protein C0W40_15225 [Photobacterium leiognathi subsp. mandapamensis]|nr:hypothetical protein C0W40_15225 [Photobacterium leiognathi subsp. mandapamensis]